jgi:hypothetical protein
MSENFDAIFEEREGNREWMWNGNTENVGCFCLWGS